MKEITKWKQEKMSQYGQRKNKDDKLLYLVQETESRSYFDNEIPLIAHVGR